MVNSKFKDLRVITGMVRFHYVNVFEPRESLDGGASKYGVCLLIPKEDRGTLYRIKRAVEETIRIGQEQGIDAPTESFRTPLRDGDMERGDKHEFAGHYFINATTKYKPEVVDKSCINITDPNEFYSGCYGRASIKFFLYNKEGNLGIGCSLCNIQKLEDGEELPTHISAAEDFSTVESLS